MARPKISDPRTELFRTRFTAAEKSELSEAAETAGMTMSKYVRHRALGRRVVSREYGHTRDELRRIGGLLKHGITQRPDMADELRQALALLTAQITRMRREDD